MGWNPRGGVSCCGARGHELSWGSAHLLLTARGKVSTASCPSKTRPSFYAFTVSNTMSTMTRRPNHAIPRSQVHRVIVRIVIGPAEQFSHAPCNQVTIPPPAIQAGTRKNTLSLTGSGHAFSHLVVSPRSSRSSVWRSGPLPSRRTPAAVPGLRKANTGTVSQYLSVGEARPHALGRLQGARHAASSLAGRQLKGSGVSPAEKPTIKGEELNSPITLPAYITDVAKVQIRCAFAEVNLGEAAFGAAITNCN